MTLERWRHRQGLAVWLVSLALLLAAVAPVASRVLAANGQTQWVQVCSADGVQWVSADGEVARSGSDPSGRSEFDDCPLCVLSAEGFAPLAKPAFSLTLGRADPDVGAPYAISWVPVRRLRSASPRGPPDAAPPVSLI